MHVADDGYDTIRVERLGGRQIALLVVGALVLFCDGFDAQILTVTAPGITTQWHVAKSAMGPIFAANLAGLMVGALTVTPLTDLFSRRRVIMACVLAFAGLTLATLLAATPTELAIARFVTGLALGAAMPSVIAAGSEYVPRALRTRLVVCLGCAFSLGSAATGFIASFTLGRYGWQSVFWLGALLPLLTLPCVAAFFPESPTFLVRRGRMAELAALLTRMGPGLVFEPRDIPTGVRQRFPVLDLFRHGRAPMTLCLWLVYFCSGATLYVLANWLPILVANAGFGPEVSSLSASAYQIGGLTGGLLLGVFVDRFGAAALSACLFAAALGVALVGPASASETTMLAAAGVAGLLIVGGQNAMNAFVGGQLYPSHMRATGLGWALGVLRLGGVLAGSLAAGLVVGLGLDARRMFLLSAAPELVCGVGLLLLTLRSRPAAQTPLRPAEGAAWN